MTEGFASAEKSQTNLWINSGQITLFLRLAKHAVAMEQGDRDCVDLLSLELRCAGALSQSLAGLHIMVHSTEHASFNCFFCTIST